MCLKLAILKDLVVIRYLAILLLLSGPVLAAEPDPTDDRSVIVASAGVSGTGKRNDPYLFTSDTKCALRLTGKSDAVKWDLDDFPSDAEAFDRIVIFSLAQPGTYLALVQFEGGYAKAWFEIRSGAGPPPVVNTLASKLRAALTGPDAAKDAVQFAAIMRGVADQAEISKPATHKPLKAMWDATLKGAGWPAGKYPLLPDVGRLAIPTAEETTPIDATQLAAIVANLRVLQKTAEAIANGK